jgi:hypothetical protein
MMKKLSILLGLVLLSFGLEGCEALSSLPFLGGGAEDTGDVTVAPATIPATTLPANPPEEGDPDGQDANNPEAGDPDFEGSVVEGEDAQLPAPDGLIPVTDRDTAIKILEQNQGRQNPFATLPVQIPQSVAAAVAAASAPAPAPASAPTANGDEGDRPLANPKLPVLPAPPIPPLARQPFVPPPPPVVPQAPAPIVPQAPSEIPPLEWSGEEEEVPEFNPNDLPELPEPTIANGLTVTGVVNLGGSMKAIVQDGDGKSRYVSPGEYLGSGQVLVKRIEMNRGPQPIVIFEELGIEVTRAVGEPPANNTNA